MLITIVLSIVIFITFSVVKIYNMKRKLIIDPSFIMVNHITIFENKLVFSGDVRGNSFYGSYDRYEYAVINNRLYIELYSSDEIYTFEDIIEFEIIDDKLCNVTQVYLKGYDCPEGYNKIRLIWDQTDTHRTQEETQGHSALVSPFLSRQRG